MSVPVIKQLNTLFENIEHPNSDTVDNIHIRVTGGELEYSLDGVTYVRSVPVPTPYTLPPLVRNITLSTLDPSGGEDGDVWIKYV